MTTDCTENYQTKQFGCVVSIMWPNEKCDVKIELRQVVELHMSRAYITTIRNPGRTNIRICCLNW